MISIAASDAYDSRTIYGAYNSTCIHLWAPGGGLAHAITGGPCWEVHVLGVGADAYQGKARCVSAAAGGASALVLWCSSCCCTRF